MKKEEILKTFLNNGIQLSKEALEYLHETKADEERLSAIMGFLDKKGVAGKKQIEAAELKASEGGLKAIRSHTPAPTNLSADDLIQDRIRTYEKIKGILESRWDLTNITSIRRISPGLKSFSLIAEVVDIDGNSQTIRLQDNTGTAEASIKDIASGFDAVAGDIMGFVCENGSTPRIKKAVFPDIPLFRDRISNKKNSAMAVFYGMKGIEADKIAGSIEDLSRKYEDFYIADFEDDYPNTEAEAALHAKIFTVLPKLGGDLDSLGIVSAGRTKIMMCHKKVLADTKDPIETMTGLLRRRVVRYQNIGSLPVLPFIIDPVPDVFITNLGRGVKGNYKNTILLSVANVAEENIFWLIDFRAYECLKISLA